jgi:hypothetical protein
VTLPVARVAHRAPGRVRLKVPARQGDRAWFGQAAGQISTCAGVTRVEANPVTASLLVRFGDGFSLAGLAHAAGAAGLFALEARAPVPALVRAGDALQELDARVRQLTGGEADVRSLVFLGLLGLAAVQALRGQVLGPASTLLWQAFDLAGGKHGLGAGEGDGNG